MLHELLLSLHGHRGIVFGGKESILDSTQSGKLKVNLDAFPFFHPAETALLNELLDVGAEYAKIRRFVDDFGSGIIGVVQDKKSAVKDGEYKPYGLYVEALCSGLLNVTESYRKALIDLERQILGEGTVLLSRVQHVIKPFEPLFHALNNLINTLKLRKAHGCAILDIVYKASFSGIAKVQEAMMAILHEGHKVLYKQLLSWILQGVLFDPFKEFFIEEVEESKSNEDQNSSEIPSNLKKSATLGSMNELSASTSNISLSSSTVNTTASTSNRNKATTSKNFILKADKVPTHISLVLAEKIFFIGESIQLFESDRKFESQGIILKDRETEIYQQLAELRDNPVFHKPNFERFVDSVRSTASQHLHSLIVKGNPDLRSELGQARDFFFLARGELFQQFIEKADYILQKPPTSTTQHDVSQIFEVSCRVTLGQDEDVELRDNKTAIQRRIKMSVASAAAVAASISQSGEKKIITGWNCLRLNFDVAYPLHLIIKEKSLESYNRVFNFLLSVKRVQWLLHRLWAEAKVSKKKNFSYSTLAQLRNHMTFVIDNLQQYFMADVLDAQFSTLMNKLDTSADFEELRSAHEVFVSNVVTQLFLDHKAVSKCINELLQVCERFCRHRLSKIARDQVIPGTSKTSAAREQQQTKSDQIIVSEIGLEFGRQSGFLFQLLSSLRGHHTGSHLAQLLLRIDFNRYFSKFGHDIGKIA